MKLQLFDSLTPSYLYELPEEVKTSALKINKLQTGNIQETFQTGVGERMLEVFEHANNPQDPIELRDLWLGRIEKEMGCHSFRPDLAEKWKFTKPLRRITSNEILTSRATIRFIKELFNWFFRDDLYGALRSDKNIILSSGSVDEVAWGLPITLKDCIRYALDRDWYGYSDSRGRLSTREAIAAYESARMIGATYQTENVAVTMGGTFAISTMADLLLQGSTNESPVLCGIPNYPPLIESIARRQQVQLVPLSSYSGKVDLYPLIAALTPNTPLVLLQTVINPTGASVPESEIIQLIKAASPSTMILLDECHECLGPLKQYSSARMASNIVRISSISKAWSAPGLKLGWILADKEIIADYYEYASTNFGGPPSFFYTFLEFMARMERWLLIGIEQLSMAELREFEPSYQLTLAKLQKAFLSYRFERHSRESAIKTLRDATIAELSLIPTKFIIPDYSINLAINMQSYNDSYKCFRELLRDSQVAVFPGILTYCLEGGIVRITTARQWSDISKALNRLKTKLSTNSS